MLGLVFEKINGYRDGSFYTPGFVTMYMARQTLGRAVLRHFAQAPAWPALAGCESIEDLQDAFVAIRRPERLAYAAHFNTLTVLDPAVGSGHFLVSALNELLALKSRLGLLLDDDGARLPYTLEVEHDELLVTDADGLPAPYRVATFEAETGLRTVGPERTRLQRALFREKRALMEHALFGVDLNPNSVRICRLRLWIELLKHAYYKPETDFRELETLPNLDLNVKPGNSLLARFALDVDLSEVFKKGGFTLKKYKEAAHEYFGSRGRDDKNTLLGFFQQLKEQFTAVLHLKDKKREDLRKFRNQRLVLETQGQLFAGSAQEQEARAFDMRRLELLADKLDAEIQAHEQGALFREAFEWRFEFPEVLDEAGAFRGFDVVMGNPPYIRQEVFIALKPHLKQRFGHVFAGTADLYVYFLQLGAELLAPGGELSYIVPNKWLRAGYGAALRGWLASSQTLLEFVDFGDLPVFPEATTYPAIVALRQGAPAAESTFRAAALPKLQTVNFDTYVSGLAREVSQVSLRASGWNMADVEKQKLLDKMHSNSMSLGDYVQGKVYYGIKTGYNAAFVIDAATRASLIASDQRAKEIIKPFLAGRDLKRYQQPQTDNYLILLEAGWTRNKLGWAQHPVTKRWQEPAKPNSLSGWEVLVANYPSVAEYLKPFEKQAASRTDKGHFWWELRACDYYDAFEVDKIVYQVFQVKSVFTLDQNGSYFNNATYIIPGNDLFLLGVLNSKIGWLLIANYCTEIQNGYQLIYEYFKRIPIPAATAAEQAAIAALVQQILAAKATDPAADTTAPEAAVDAAVAALYGVALPGASGEG